MSPSLSQITSPVSIHAPARGATVALTALAGIWEFQSTPPRGGRQQHIGSFDARTLYIDCFSTNNLDMVLFHAKKVIISLVLGQKSCEPKGTFMFALCSQNDEHLFFRH